MLLFFYIFENAAGRVPDFPVLIQEIVPPRNERRTMMKKFLVLAVLVIAVAYSTSSYGAGYGPGSKGYLSGSKGLYAGIGGSIALENFDMRFPGEHKTLGAGESWGVNGKAGYHLSNWFSLELDFNYLFEFESEETELRIFTIMPVLKACTGHEPINPFVAVGLGYMDVAFDKKISSPTITSSDSYDKSDIAAKVGLGIDFFASNNLSIEIEADYVFGMGNLDDIAYWNFTLGVCYYFGTSR